MAWRKLAIARYQPAVASELSLIGRDKMARFAEVVRLTHISPPWQLVSSNPLRRSCAAATWQAAETSGSYIAADKAARSVAEFNLCFVIKAPLPAAPKLNNTIIAISNPAIDTVADPRLVKYFIPQ